jgi:hypothetical protein
VEGPHPDPDTSYETLPGSLDVNQQETRNRYYVLLLSVLGIWMFLGLPDPDQIVRGMDLDPDPSLRNKGVERTEIMLAKLNFNTVGTSGSPLVGI